MFNHGNLIDERLIEKNLIDEGLDEKSFIKKKLNREKPNPRKINRGNLFDERLIENTLNKNVFTTFECDLLEPPIKLTLKIDRHTGK